ncbi:actin cytoskeleton-regulatory complex protein pan-1-like [Lingula anatina]|uniref:Actin cytoskeleton-regulatory complex protein pan-1-like n=1 Tax=Lingula anatina TaxID=7574 RepID=A0A1S3IM17_LINAN|nr:actin cytoskeleton-regulatory complex protein pan-1-like [Lingula anatina]|eukprot:XP_013399128.1 actin cytoskeleton-regulatory complex protein pan-1-like [Lingula anatina]
MGKVPLAQRRKILKAVNAVAKTENKPTKGLAFRLSVSDKLSEMSESLSETVTRIGKLGNKLGIGKPAPPPKDFKPESNNNNDDTYDWDSDEWEDGMDDTEGGFEDHLDTSMYQAALDAEASVEESFYLDAQERPTIFARLASNQEPESDDSADYIKPENNLPPPPGRRPAPPPAPDDDDMPPPPPPPRPPKPGEKPAIGHSNKPPPVPACVISMSHYMIRYGDIRGKLTTSK